MMTRRALARMLWRFHEESWLAAHHAGSVLPFVDADRQTQAVYDGIARRVLEHYHVTRKRRRPC